MKDINWKLAPEGAEKIIQLEDTITWAKGGHYWSVASDNWEADVCENENIVIATRPTQTKTVADAVEWAKGVWGDYNYGYISYNPNTEQFSYTSSDVNRRWYIVCTRAEFEAYVNASKIGKILESSDEKEGEKWTHTYLGENCYVVHVDGCAAWVVVQNAGGKIITTNSLKPIKPTISRSDENALRAFAVWYENETDCESLLDEYLAKHEVIEG